jgi:hypothetical protein
MTYIDKKTLPGCLICKRTVPTELPPLVGKYQWQLLATLLLLLMAIQHLLVLDLFFQTQSVGFPGRWISTPLGSTCAEGNSKRIDAQADIGTGHMILTHDPRTDVIMSAFEEGDQQNSCRFRQAGP